MTHRSTPADPTLVQQLRAALSAPLPGRQAQYAMAARSRSRPVRAPEHARKAAVLVLFYPAGREWHLVLIERVSNRNDRHSGQISLPGGRYDRSDADLRNTALREAEEEVGVAADRIELLGALTDLYIPVSNYDVQPFVGYAAEQPAFIPQPEEVADIIEVPLTALLDISNEKRTRITLGANIELNDVPYFDLQGKVVWGATAMILSELRTALNRTW